MIYQNTFTVARLKKLVSEKLRLFFIEEPNGRTSIAKLFDRELAIIKVSVIIDFLKSTFIFTT